MEVETVDSKTVCKGKRSWCCYLKSVISLSLSWCPLTGGHVPLFFLLPPLFALPSSPLLSLPFVSSPPPLRHIHFKSAPVPERDTRPHVRHGAGSRGGRHSGGRCVFRRCFAGVLHVLFHIMLPGCSMGLGHVADGIVEEGARCGYNII